MTRYSVQTRDLIFVKGYGFLSLAKNMGKNIGENISKNLSSKHSQKILDHGKHHALKTASKRAIQKISGAKVLMKLQESQKLLQEIIQKRMKKKYLEKNIYHWN